MGRPWESVTSSWRILSYVGGGVPPLNGCTENQFTYRVQKTFLNFEFGYNFQNALSYNYVHTSGNTWIFQALPSVKGIHTRIWNLYM